MREIKFRAWDKRNKKMYKHEEIYIWDRFMKDDMSFQYAPLMQYTGLKDKNGEEIYEGDILEYKSTFGKNERTELLLVSWSNTDGMWCMGYIRTDYAIRNSSVIGNIYEHPELLEVKQ